MISPKLVGAGAFVVLGALLFVAVLFMIGERRLLFEDRFTVYTEFSTLGQLERGAVVRVAGLSAGRVIDIQIPDSPARKFRVKMEVRAALRPLLRADSLATIQTEGVVGGTFVNIATGTDRTPVVAEGGTIPGREPFVLADLLQQASETIAVVTHTVTRVSDDMEKAVEQIALTAEDAHELMTGITPQIQAIAQNGSRIAADTQQVVEKMRTGEGTIGKLINDESLYQRARQMVTEAGTVMANVRQVTDEARRAVTDFRSENGPAHGLVADVRVALTQAREVTADLADNMEALKHNFLLRGFFNRRGYFDLDAISPSEYRSGALENGKRRAMRIWLSSGVIFAPRQDGSDAITAEGRTRVDSAMATFLKYIPSHPLVVEGYATGGTASDRFRQSRQRAGVVREYLLGRYGLMPQHTGFIALGADALESPSGDRWDGVALTLFLDPKAVRFATQGRHAGASQTPGGSAAQ
ncbi:MAG: MlaD family protein [Vicinamibacterales bacterium]